MNKIIILLFIFIIGLGYNSQDKGITQVLNPQFSGAELTIPKSINFQGYLYRDGNPMDTTMDMWFGIYNNSSGGNLLYERLKREVTITTGWFTVILDNLPDSVFPVSGPTRYLEVEAPADSPPLTPRISLVSVGYSYHAITSDTAEYSKSGQITRPISPTIATNEITDEAVTMAKINQSGATNGEVITWNGSSWEPDSPPGGISGSGTTGYVARWTGSATLGNSSIQDDASDHIAVGTSPITRYRIYGFHSSLSYGGLGVSDKGVLGFCGVDTGYGIYGYTNSATGYGVYGYHTAPSYGYLGGRSYGVYGEGNIGGVYGRSDVNTHGILGCDGPVDAGVYGFAEADGDYGVYGTIAGSGYGVYGYVTDSGSVAVGGTALGTDGIAVRGFSQGGIGIDGIDATGSGIGVRGAGATGVYGNAAGSGTGVKGMAGYGGTGVQGIGDEYGVYGVTPGAIGGYGVYGVSQGFTGGYGVYGTSVGGRGGYFRNQNNNYYALTAWNTTGSGATIRGLYVQGHGVATGGWQTFLDEDNTGFSLTSSDMELVASGSASLVDGKANITFESTFQNAISKDVALKVIVTPTAYCNGVYVSEKSASGFTVAELAEGKSNATFDWIAIGRVQGYEERIKTKQLHAEQIKE